MLFFARLRNRKMGRKGLEGDGGGGGGSKQESCAVKVRPGFGEWMLVRFFFKGRSLGESVGSVQ